MKKLTFISLLMGIIMIPQLLLAQSTEGKDFWVTLMQADSDNPTELSLTFSAKKAATVRVQNEYTMYDTTMTLADNEIKRLILDSADCYVSGRHAETPVGKALHVTSDVEISVIAANYRDKSFDVAAILPTAALRSEYRIQCYPPTAHANTSQGTHFVIIAAEDNVEVDYTLAANTNQGHYAGQTYTTPKMQKGQAYYVWTGNGTGDNYDFSGTVVKAKDNKKIAVFNGNVHTNIPNAIRDRDHIYSQAMPINYWGKKFAVTSSLTTLDYNTKIKKKVSGTSSSETKEGRYEGNGERIDKVRVQAIVDSTVVMVDGDTVHVFNFATNPHHTYEFDFGQIDSIMTYKPSTTYPYFAGSSHYIETSCPCAVHLFFTSNRYDHDKDVEIIDTVSYVDSKNFEIHTTKWSCNGDPSEIWVNPIEQTMTSMTFGNFETNQVKDHYVNIVTETTGTSSMVLDGENIASQFSALNGNPSLSFARIKIENKTHTMSCDAGFTAHVYGFGSLESYGYPAGGNTRDLSAAIYINGVKYTSGSTAKLCGDDTIPYKCEVNYEYDSIYWYFGDGKDTMSTDLDSIKHVYTVGGTYHAYVKIFRDPTAVDDCLQGMIESHDFDSIAFVVNIGKYKVNVRGEMPTCTKQGEPTTYVIYMTSPSGVKFGSDSVKLAFNQTAIDDGFTNDKMHIQSDSVLTIDVPSTAINRKVYGINMHVGSECPSSVMDTTLEFALIYDINFMEQRFANVIGIMRDSFPNQILSDFVWTADGDTLPNQQNSVLHLSSADNGSIAYVVCFTVTQEGKAPYRYCSCPVYLDPNKNDQLIYQDGSEAIVIGANCAKEGEQVFVNALAAGTATWYGPDGNVYAKAQLPEGGGLIKSPTRAGLYILNVDAGHQRTFKFLVFSK